MAAWQAGKPTPRVKIVPVARRAPLLLFALAFAALAQKYDGPRPGRKPT
jgi:hypothetical protein